MAPHKWGFHMKTLSKSLLQQFLSLIMKELKIQIFKFKSDKIKQTFPYNTGVGLKEGE